MSHYLDASAIVPLLVEEASSPAVGAYIAGAGGPIIISDFAAAEFASALSRLVRMSLIARDAADILLREFDVWRASVTIGVEIVSADIRLANLFVRRFDLGLRTPDALHTAICQRGSHTLVTLDTRLATAAEALGIRTDCLS